MNEVSLHMIKSSPSPIRKSWDEDKMDELVQSIKEKGVIVPIKVRPLNANARGLARYNGDLETKSYWDNAPNDDEPEYEIVYGHRRVEASKRAGLEEIPVTIEDLSDWDAYLQQVIENETREDVSILDRGRGYEYALNHPENKKQGNITALSRLIGVNEKTISEAITYLGQVKEGVIQGSSDSLGIRQAVELKRVLGSNTEAKKAIFEKSQKEDLNWRETKSVAEAYKAAESPRLQAAVLDVDAKVAKTPEAILNTARAWTRDPDAVKKSREVTHLDKRRKALESFDRAVASFIETTDTYRKVVHLAQESVRFDKFSPEAKQFTRRRLLSLKKDVDILLGMLED